MEKITRIRTTPGGRDEYGDPIPSTTERKTIAARAVAPGSSRAYIETGRDGSDVQFTLYFTRAVDITDDDEVEVRGSTYKARVADWRSAYGTGRRGTVIEATRRTG